MSAGAAPEPIARRLSFRVESGEELSARLLAPHQPRVLYVLAHGAGAGMDHAFMQAMAVELAAREMASFRYNFPYIELRRGRPDRTSVLTGAVRRAVAAAAEALPGVPLIAGGKSMGGRMTSEAQAQLPLPGVRGLAFLGFPLHPPGREGTERAAHLTNVLLPMLFLQGSRDAFAEPELIRSVTSLLRDRATLEMIDQADHGFHVPKRSGLRDAEVIGNLAERVRLWVDERILSSPSAPETVPSPLPVPGEAPSSG